MCALTPQESDRHFLPTTKDLDEGKWVEIDGWGDAEEAKKELQESFDAYKK